MKCRQIKKLISAYVDGELDQEKIKEVRAHLQTCPACAAELGKLQQAWTWLELLPAVKAPAFFATKVLRKIEERSKLSRLQHYLGDFLNRALIPATVAAGILAGVFLGNQLNQRLQLQEEMANIDPAIQAVTTASEDFTVVPPGSLSETYLVAVSSTPRR